LIFEWSVTAFIQIMKLFVVLAWLSLPAALLSQEHVVVRKPPAGRGFMAPNNGGIWCWGDEIVVMYVNGFHKNGTHCSSHSTIEGRAGVSYATSRSVDGGRTWGDHRQAFLRHTERCAWQGRQPVALTEAVDFLDAKTAIHFQRDDAGRTYFYVSRDRGLTWDGPFNNVPMFADGVNGRTMYRAATSDRLTAYMQVQSLREKGVLREDSYAVTTDDGGLTWRLGVKLSETKPFGEGRSVQWHGHPSVTEVGDDSLLAVFRSGHQTSNRDRTAWTGLSRSVDGGQTWKMLPPLAESPGNNGCPAQIVTVKRADGGSRAVALMWIRPPDKKACEKSSLIARVSDDAGESWSAATTLRDDAFGWDTGYPIATVNAKGEVVVCYWIKTESQDEPNYVACTIWDAANAVIVPDQTVSYVATADTCVNSQSATCNFGTADRVNVHQSATRQMESYLRLNLANFNGRKVTTATLCVKEQPSASAATNNTAIAVRPVAISWTETGTNWNTRPTLSSTTLGTAAANTIVNK
jgi:hypothetical protein